jgi:hypothetical protein
MRGALRVDAGLPPTQVDPTIDEPNSSITKEQRCNAIDARR